MHFHVTSTRNRESILAHGLDWTRMGAAPGIAGAQRPEAPGVFLVDSEDMADYFVQMNNTGGPVDVWAVDGVDPGDLVGNGTGYFYFPAGIPPTQLTLLRRDAARGLWERQYGGSSGAYQSSITITLDDGTVLRDAEAHEWIAARSQG